MTTRESSAQGFTMVSPIKEIGMTAVTSFGLIAIFKGLTFVGTVFDLYILNPICCFKQSYKFAFLLYNSPIY